MERKRLKDERDSFSTGTLNWEWVPQDRPAYQTYNIMVCARPAEGASYVIKFVEPQPGERVLYLFRSIHDDKRNFLACRPEPRMMELCRLAERHATFEPERGQQQEEAHEVAAEPVAFRRSQAPTSTPKKAGTLF